MPPQDVQQEEYGASPDLTEEEVQRARKYLANPLPGEEVVVSGISGKYPESDNVEQFRDNLFNKVNLITSDNRRWEPIYSDIPKYAGKVSHIEQFDAGFFGVSYRQAEAMDPQIRVLLEKAHECVIDAGINPMDLMGKKCGVFVGTGFSESESHWYFEDLLEQGYATTGNIRAMQPNRISYFLKVNGPSYVTDTACSSSLKAIDDAYLAIRLGVCDYAIVGGTQLCLHPFATLQFYRLGVLNFDGACKTFDVDANGYVRAEAIVAVFIQKSKDAKRIYARVVHSKSNCDGFKEQGITYPNGENQQKLLRELYFETKIDPLSIDYIEAHGTSTRVGDPEEVASVDKVFCSGREKPFLIGSVKSNMGHSEPASGLASLSKVIIAMETGFLPPNMHYKKPREGVKALEEGRIKVVTEKTPLEVNGAKIGINNFGFGGANIHTLFQQHQKKKINSGLPRDDIPRLVCYSGRVEESMNAMADALRQRKLDSEYVALLHNVFYKDIPGYLHRGYSIITKSGEIVRSRRSYKNGKNKLYIGFGIHDSWKNLGKQLMTIPLFSAAIHSIHNILTGVDVNITDIITNNVHDDAISNHILGNVAVQIGIINILKAIGVKPDGVFGNSSGEILCAYFDDILNLQETVLMAYEWARPLNQKCEPMSSYILELNGEKESTKIPYDAEETGIISDKSVVVSGMVDSMNTFVNNVKNRHVEVIELYCGKVGLKKEDTKKHKDVLLEKFQHILREPRGHSSIWIGAPKQVDAAYFLEALITPVDYQKLQKNISHGAVIFEIGSEQMASVLKYSQKSKQNEVLSLDQTNTNSVVSLLKALGSLYENGCDLQLDKMYPKVDFPVSRGTPMIAPLLRWEHSKDWFVALIRHRQAKVESKVSVRSFTIDSKEEPFTYVSGHVVDGLNLFPATGYLYLVTELMCILTETLLSDIKLIFENCKFNRATNLPREGTITLDVMIQQGTGNFEVTENTTSVVTGRVRAVTDTTLCAMPRPSGVSEIEALPLQRKDIYKELKLRGYNYRGAFKGLVESDSSAERGTIHWNGNMVAFMDNMLQLKIVQMDSRSLFVPTYIEKVTVDFKKHREYAEQFGVEEPNLPVYVASDSNLIRSGYFEIVGLSAMSIARRKPLGEPVLEKYQFVPNETTLSTHESIRVNTKMILENDYSVKIKVVEVVDEATTPNSKPLGPLILEAFSDEPLIAANVTILSNQPLELENMTAENRPLNTEKDCLLIVGSNLLSRPDALIEAFASLKESGFILSREPLSGNTDKSIIQKISTLTIHQTETEKLVLFKKISIFTSPTIVCIDGDDFNWLEPLKEEVKKENNLVVYSQGEPLCGIMGLINCLRRENIGTRARCFFIMDKNLPKFDLGNAFYKKQFQKNMAINVYKSGKWGTFKHFLLENTKQVECEHSYVDTTVKGDLSSLSWIEGPLTLKEPFINPDTTLVYISYAALNFKDVMIASGRLNTDDTTLGRTHHEGLLGLEFSGKTANGRRVMGMTAAGGFANLVAADDNLLIDVPNHWTLEEAATVPVVYATVLYAFYRAGGLRRGQSVLIHAGAGGVGQAAINIALHYGCEVFTTVGTPDKRTFIKEKFPKIKDSHIGNSRDESFEQMIMKETKHRGVDIILNSLAEEKLIASVRCLAHGGSFLEIGKFDLSNNNSLSLMLMEKEANHHGVFLDAVFAGGPAFKKLVTGLVSDGIKRGCVKPLKRHIFREDQIEEAFRFMAGGKHIGKVIVTVGEKEAQQRAKSKPLKKSAIPKYYCNPAKSYIICGGLGGFGLELADWLVLRGARKIVLTSRTGVKNGYQAMRIRTWKKYGTEVVISTCDISTKQGCRELLKRANDLGPVHAIFNLAVILKDSLIEDQTVENFTTSFLPKACATRHLDELSRKLCPELRDFVIFSSVSCGRGNAGQTNYGMANSVMERICEKRREEGLPATAIEWGAVGDVGLVADMQEEDRELEIGGTLQQRILSCLEVMDIFLKQNHPVVASMVVAEKQSGASCDNCVEAVANILGIKNLKIVSYQSTLAELGMDSMRAVEVKQTLERDFNILLTAKEVRNLTLLKLEEMSAKDDSGAKENVEGVNSLLSFIDEDTLRRTVNIKLHTKAPDNSDAPNVIILPGIEGVAPGIKPLAKKLECHGTALQFSFECEDTLEDTAGRLIKYVQETMSKNKTFSMIGYSLGGILALEIAAILESKGCKGNILLLDSHPYSVKEYLKDSVRPETMDTDLICRIMEIFIPERTVASNRDKIAKPISVEDKIRTALKIFVGDNLNEDTQKSVEVMLFSMHKNLKAAMDYNPKYPKIKSPVTLFKPTENINKNLPEDYNLKQFCENLVKIDTFEGNHVSVLDDPQLAIAVNEWLKN